MQKSPEQKPYEKKTYEPKLTDAKWRKKWKEGSYFTADAKSKKHPYTIVIPPPNVTGALHMGHALGFTLQDILIRWKRMSGFEALWLPGTDHAGIATQTVVERYLIETQGKRRIDYPRETFLKYVWEWKEKNESRIINQIEMMGCSCDWSRQRFTMDEGCNLAVRKVFKRLYDKKLIVQDNYLVNWDPVTQTALADDEVEEEERPGHLWFFKYPLSDGSGFIPIATTRPETLLGDTAVAVNPSDERYTSLIGKMVRLPLINREIPIIGDHRIHKEFGTGAVKITPAHDPNDYQISIDHKLPLINIMNPDATINENGGSFAGLSMQKGREAVVEAIKALGLFINAEPYTLRVGISYRSKAVIEPYLSKQWFVRMEGFAKKLRAAVEEKRVSIIPENWTKTYFHWIDNLHDWCISRQLWWGHRIPIWYHQEDPSRMLCYDGEGEPPEVRANPSLWRQDEDVLDTWFSSALWPFSTLGWPNDTEDLKKFYPTSVLETGHDILFFWVARMLMMGEEVMGELPFPETYLHGLIYGRSYWRKDEAGVRYITGEEQAAYDSASKAVPADVHSKWEKMSKSKGNIIDPLEIIEQYGTDAMRMGLASSATQAREIDLDRRKFEEFKNFANKVWNGARFVLMNIGEEKEGALSLAVFAEGLQESLMNIEDRYILSALYRTIDQVNSHLTNYAFDLAATLSYDFFWKEFCAYYVEIVKPVLFGKRGTQAERIHKQKMLVILLSNALRLLHPMTPFITEELFEALKQTLCEPPTSLLSADPLVEETLQALASPVCCLAPYPQAKTFTSWHNPQVEAHFQMIADLIYAIRNVRAEMQISPGAAIDVHIVRNQGEDAFAVIAEHTHILAAMIKINKISLYTSEPSADFEFSTQTIVHGMKILIPFPKEMVEKEKERLIKEKEKLLKSIEQYKNQLSNPDFVSKAPSELIEKFRKQLTLQEEQMMEINSKLI